MMMAALNPKPLNLSVVLVRSPVAAILAGIGTFKVVHPEQPRTSSEETLARAFGAFLGFSVTRENKV